MKNKAAVALGRIGGKAKSEAKAKAARENAKKQRPRLVTAIAYEFRPKGGGADCFGLILEKGNIPCDLEKNHDACIAMIEKHAGRECLDLWQFASITRRI